MNQHSADQSERLNQIIAGCLQAKDAGEPLNQDDIIARRPEFKTDLEAFFQEQRLFNSLLWPRIGEDFEIIHVIDDGGQGVVYKANQKSLTKTVAVKIPRDSTLQYDQDAIRKEARRAARLRHPNIVPGHHVGEHEGRPFIVMDFIEGDSLAKRIAKAPMRPSEAARLTKSIAEAIHLPISGSCCIAI